MTTSDGDKQLWRQEDHAGQKKEPANTADGQTSLASTPLQAPRFPFPSAGPAFLDMLAILSHEFSTPLAVIDGYTSTLLSQRQRLPPEEQREFLQMILQAGRRLEKLTVQVLEIGQFEAGAIQLDRSLIDISTLAREAISHAEYCLPEPLRGRLTFALECRDALGNPMQDPPLVNGDVQRLHQLLACLLENAISYSSAGGRIDVIVQPAPHAGSSDGPRQADDTSFLEICVCDLGMGISPEHLERIFEPFYQVDTRLTREHYGLGLGLTACRHLVALHHGRIWAESCPDGGSAFHVWLPLEGPILAS